MISPQILVRYTSSWHDLKHPNVLSVYGVSQSSEEPLFVVVPYHENGNIQEWIAGRDDLDRNRLVLDVALGMQYLHAVRKTFPLHQIVSNLTFCSPSSATNRSRFADAVQHPHQRNWPCLCFRL
ncbi:hypothetical protein L218DRAFT_882969 [Marasmius fiardii PR-910]|nr:hypothetical protein L218DRAFT_882969 [Marasmius fiardii PR-910]